MNKVLCLSKHGIRLDATKYLDSPEAMVSTPPVLPLPPLAKSQRPWTPKARQSSRLQISQIYFLKNKKA